MFKEFGGGEERIVMISRLIPNPYTFGWFTASHKEKEDPGSPNKTKQNQTKPKVNHHLPDPTGNKTEEKQTKALAIYKLGEGTALLG